jgi:hypothetical protein
MNAPIEVSNHQFKVSPAVIRKLIFQQAGSFPKSIIELVMNEIDARASEVTITTGEPNSKGMVRTLSVEGDGGGFTSHDEILKLFGKLGFNHSTDEEMAKNRRYGRFGIGRAAILTFGKCKWITNEFEICVDLDQKSKDAPPYTITEHETKLYNGCRVEVTLNKPISAYEVRDMISHTSTMLKFSPKNIIINGLKVNEGIGPEWDILSDSVALLLSKDEQDGLDVYNDGIFVCSYPHSHFGVSGKITSVDATFDVNMARNDILQTSCVLWKSLKRLLKPFSDTVTKKTTTFSLQDRLFMMKGFLENEIEYGHIAEKGLIKAVNGRFYPISQALPYAETRFSLSSSKNSNIGEAIHNSREAFVVSPDWLYDLGYETLEDFFEKLSDSVSKSALEWSNRSHQSRYSDRGLGHRIAPLYQRFFQKPCIQILDIKNLEKNYSSTSEIINEKELGDIDSIKLRTMQYLSDLVFREHFYRYNSFQKENSVFKRVVRFGVSESALAWTNSSTFIALDKGYTDLMFDSGLDGFFNLFSVILHEYCHDTDSKGDHSHSNDFYRQFNAKLNPATQFIACEKTIVFFYKQLIKDGLTITSDQHEKNIRKAPQHLAAALNQL